MTDREHAQAAAKEFRKTTITHAQWLRNCDLFGKPYRDKSHWGKGFAALAKIGAGSPPSRDVDSGGHGLPH